VEREVTLSGEVTADLFLAVHNLFNGSQFFFTENTNPRRWGEAGIRLKF
jgi:hypothetical protein